MNSIISRGKVYLRVVILLFLFFGSSCILPEQKPDDDPNNDDPVLVAEQQIPKSGGDIVVDYPGSPIDGMKIEVPANSYTNSRDFKIHTMKLPNDNFGQYFNPISPLIVIGNEGGYSENVMKVTIPIDLPKGHFAMGFLYDESTGRLEGLPVEELTSTSITLVTRHFMSGDQLLNKSSSIKSAELDLNSRANIVITSMSEEAFKNKIITTGFTPGIDDFEFANRGSYISPDGHCAGQSISMMWYYYEKKLYGSPSLFGHYDQLNNLWMDNPFYYKWASVVQIDLDWDGKMIEILKKIRKDETRHYMSWNAFAYSMLLTGCPQYVGLSSKDGGHAIVAYKISVSDGILYVADSNYPGIEYQIEYKNGKFVPYESKFSEKDIAKHAFDGIGYTAVSALIDWDKVSERYDEVEQETIGQNGSIRFPPCNINVLNDLTHVSGNTFSTVSDTLSFYVDCPTAERGKVIDGKTHIAFNIYDDTGSQVDHWLNDLFGAYVVLKPGMNKVGFYIYGQRNSSHDAEGNYFNSYIDFMWFNIELKANKLRIEPGQAEAKPNEAVVLTAETESTLPANPLYKWDFGDGTGIYPTSNNSVSYTYTKAGTYSVSVELWDNETNKKVATASGEVKVSDDESELLTKLHQYKYVVVSLAAEIKSNESLIGWSGIYIGNSTIYAISGNFPIIWNGTTFSLSFDYQCDDLIMEDIGRYIGSISMSLSSDGRNIETVSANETISYATTYDIMKKTISMVNIPYSEGLSDDKTMIYSIEGSTVQQHVTALNIKWDVKDEEQNIVSYYDTEVIYSSSSEIRITFYND